MAGQPDIVKQRTVARQYNQPSALLAMFQVAMSVPYGNVVKGRDNFLCTVAVQIENRGTGKPAGIADAEVTDEPGFSHVPAAADENN